MDAEAGQGTEPRRRNGDDSARNLWGLLGEFGGTLLDVGRLELRLLGDDVQREIRRAAQALMLGTFVAVLCGVALLMTALTVVIGFWDSPYRLLAAILGTLGLLAIAGYSWSVVRKKLRGREPSLNGAVEAGLLLAAYKRLIR